MEQNIEENQLEKLEVVNVVTLSNGTHARELRSFNKDVECREFKISEIMLGAGTYRKAIKYEKNFLKPEGEYMAQVLENGKLRIVQSIFG